MSEWMTWMIDSEWCIMIDENQLWREPQTFSPIDLMEHHLRPESWCCRLLFPSDGTCIARVFELELGLDWDSQRFLCLEDEDSGIHWSKASLIADAVCLFSRSAGTKMTSWKCWGNHNGHLLTAYKYQTNFKKSFLMSGGAHLGTERSITSMSITMCLFQLYCTLLATQTSAAYQKDQNLEPNGDFAKLNHSTPAPYSHESWVIESYSYRVHIYIQSLCSWNFQKLLSCSEIPHMVRFETLSPFCFLCNIIESKQCE